jgi:hypothetical protein
MVTGMFTVAWGMTVVFSFLPKYMNDVLNYNIQQVRKLIDGWMDGWIN